MSSIIRLMSQTAEIDDDNIYLNWQDKLIQTEWERLNAKSIYKIICNYIQER
jgi:hypothetical protein